MKKKGIVLASFLIVAVLGFLAYRSPYELRLVPNRPHLRPGPSLPSPLEAKARFALEGGSERDNRGYPQREIIDLASAYPGLFFREGPLKEKRVALTFDDGPDSVYTPQILDILKERNVKATFFLIGNRVETFPDIVTRMVQEGHIIGNHTMTHPVIVKLSNTKVQENILQAEEALSKIIGYRPALFRSPYGSLNPAKIELLNNLNYKIIAWNVDSLDWKSLTAEQVKFNILENVREGSIILQHSAGGEGENLTGTVEALRDVIATLQKENFQFVTIPQLLNISYVKE